MSILTPSTPMDGLLLTGLTSLCFQAIFFAVSLCFRTEKLVDVAGCANFVILAVISLILGPGPTARKSLITTYVTVWGARLGIFLFMRILHWGRDRRIERLHRNVWRMSVFWVMQAVWAWVTSFPVTLANFAPAGPALSWRDAVVGVIIAAAIMTEAVADMAKLSHRQEDDESGKPWVDYGPWQWSRHPNYFAEITTWWAILIAAWLDIPPNFHWVACLGPLLITSLLLFVTGVPVLEKSADRKYGDREDYLAYKRETSVLIPIPPSIYKTLPAVVKKTLFLEFGMYHHSADQNPLIPSKGDA